MAVRRLALEGAAESVEEWQQLGDGGEGTLGQEGELQGLRGRLLAQAVERLRGDEGGGKMRNALRDVRKTRGAEKVDRGIVARKSSYDNVLLTSVIDCGRHYIAVKG